MHPGILGPSRIAKESTVSSLLWTFTQSSSVIAMKRCWEETCSLMLH